MQSAENDNDLSYVGVQNSSDEDNFRTQLREVGANDAVREDTNCYKLFKEVYCVDGYLLTAARARIGIDIWECFLSSWSDFCDDSSKSTSSLSFSAFIGGLSTFDPRVDG